MRLLLEYLDSEWVTHFELCWPSGCSKIASINYINVSQANLVGIVDFHMYMYIVLTLIRATTSKTYLI